MKRSEAKELIVQMGGRLGSSVGRDTDFLVVGQSPGSKLQKAKELGIRILQETDLFRLLREEGRVEDYD